MPSPTSSPTGRAPRPPSRRRSRREHDVAELGPAHQRRGDHLAERADQELVVGVHVPHLRRALDLQEAFAARSGPSSTSRQRGRAVEVPVADDAHDPDCSGRRRLAGGHQGEPADRPLPAFVVAVEQVDGERLAAPDRAPRSPPLRSSGSSGRGRHPARSCCRPVGRRGRGPGAGSRRDRDAPAAPDAAGARAALEGNRLGSARQPWMTAMPDTDVAQRHRQIDRFLADLDPTPGPRGRATSADRPT